LRVLGVDPGLTRCGLDEPAMRLLALQIEIDEWMARYEPDSVAVERVFAKANIKGIMGTAQASAVPMLAAARLGLPLAMHTPTEIKAAVTGNGRADKAQVTAMVTRILRLDTPPRPADAADALALAICQVWRGTAQNRLQQAVTAQLAAQVRSAQEKTAQRESAQEKSVQEKSVRDRTARQRASRQASQAGSR